MQQRSTFFISVLLCLLSGSLGKKGFGPGEQEWGYVTVRPSAHMFWWLYYTTANVNSFYEKPLLIWLQGGPGGSSTSFGNFEELGPLDTDLKTRNYTWVKDYNVLFIDNPVGTGFSYVENSAAYARTNAQIAKDLVECMRGFLNKLPRFANVSTYILTESYGGKMGAEFALVWYKAQKAGTIKSNLKGVGLGDAWISPIDSVMTWAPFLLSTGMIDSEGFNDVDKMAKATKEAVDTGRWLTATSLWGTTENVILRVANNIDFYNILTKLSPNSIYAKLRGDASTKDTEALYRMLLQQEDRSLEQLMNGPVKNALGLTVSHGLQSGYVFSVLREDFMKPVVDKVELLLNETDINVFVYTGHMDLIVDTPGTLLWVERLRWKNIENWRYSLRRPLISNNIIEGYVKKYNKFGMYWVNRAGHMVPKDNPPAMARILQDMTGK
ncbi:hypothetical protein KPH14_004680 [Odynerus spinipes]|uniref:Carboxypeptidase n=1 Tax=Odynerus spinipes TaxID=1348599 RepID=A0AAD9RM85_9HYME|nr:hypothetical protein KPH14_004680 [Odynerus spinipes]